MNSAANQVYFASLYATLIWGVIVTESSTSTTNVIVLIFFFLGAFFCQSLLFGSRYFALDRSIAHESATAHEFYYRGTTLNSNRFQKREQEYLALTFGQKKRWAVRGVAFLFIMALLLATRRAYQFSLSFSTCLQFIAVLSVLPVASYRHYIVVLLASVLAIILSAVHAGEASSWAYFLYCGFLFMTLAIQNQRALIEAYFRQAHFRQTPRRDVIKTLCETALFLMILWSLDRFITVPHLPDLKIKLSAADKLGSRATFVTGSGNGIDRGHQNENPPTPPPTAKNLNSNDVKSDDASQDYSKDRRENRSQTQRPLQEPVPFKDSKSSMAAAKMPERSALEQSGPRQGPTQSEAAGDAGTPNSTTENSAGEQKSTPKHKPWPTDELLDAVFKALKLLTIVALGMALVEYFTRSKNNSKNQKVKLSKEDRSRLRHQLKALKAEHLTPREEVIKTYHLFLRIMAAANHERETYLPPRAYAANLAQEFPQLHLQFESLTELFSDTLYGELAVDEAKLKRYSASFSKVSRVFLA